MVCPKGEGARRWHERIDGIEIFRYPLPTTAAGLTAHLAEYAVAMPASLILSLLAWRGRRFDVVHACNPPDFFFPIGRLFRALGSAFVFDQHDLAPEVYVAQGGRKGGVGASVPALVRAHDLPQRRCGDRHQPVLPPHRDRAGRRAARARAHRAQLAGPEAHLPGRAGSGGQGRPAIPGQLPGHHGAAGRRRPVRGGRRHRVGSAARPGALRGHGRRQPARRAAPARPATVA